MSKFASDNRLRTKAVPFEATPYGLDSGGTIYDSYLLTESATTIGIRCATPYNANIITAALTLLMDVGSSLTVKVGIGSFADDGVNKDTLPSQAEIDRVHEILTGQSAAVASSGGVLFLDGINLMPVLPKPGSAKYNQDGFVLVLQFSRARTGSDSVRKFFALCTAEMGLK